MTSHFTNETPESRIECFHADAAAYCDFIDSIGKEEIPHLYATLAELLANLAASAHYLPQCYSIHNPPAIPRQDYQKLLKQIGPILSDAMQDVISYYKDNIEELVRCTMLNDDLSDLYMDLKEGLDHYAVGDADNKVHAVWFWKLRYETHWGEHLFDAMKTVHLIRFQFNHE